MGDYDLRSKAEKLTRDQKKRSKRNRIRSGLAMVVVISTLYGLLLPAFTIEKATFCGFSEHVHTDECYELICGKEEGDGHQHDDACYAEKRVLTCGKEDAEGHTHGDACYETERELTCGQKESEGHSHSDKCYETERELVCGKDESKGHTHSADCYNEDGELTCGKEESEGHKHSADCYKETRKLVCGKEESEGHSHSDACYTETTKLICNIEESAGHTHTDACYDVQKVLICEQGEAEAHQHTDACYAIACGKVEHTHTADCYNNAKADVENEKIWKQTLPVFRNDEDALQRFVAIAASQLGYKESIYNYETDGDLQRGITRYGQWFGKPYADWDGMFVSFCLNYTDTKADELTQNEADVKLLKTLAAEADAVKMQEAFVLADRFAAVDAPEEYIPAAGDIVFFKDAETEKITAGIVFEISEKESKMEVILGNAEDAVRQVKFAFDDDTVQGFGRLAEVLKPAEETEPETTLPVVDPLESTEAETEEDSSAEADGEETENRETGKENETAAPAKIIDFTGKTDTVTVRVEAPEGALPEGTVMKVTPVKAEDVMDAVTDVVENEIVRVDAVDIAFYFNNEEIEPALPVRVFMQPVAAVKNVDEPVLVHVDDAGNAEKVEPVDLESLQPAAQEAGEPETSADETELETTAPETTEETTEEIVFESDSFSVYALVYTVDFHWEVDGKTYEFSIPGGGSVDLRTLIEILGAAEKDGKTVAEDGTEYLPKFMESIKTVEFSDPDLVWVGKAGEDTTIGRLKEQNALVSEYSDELTEEQIAQINARTAAAGSWVLISLKPFDTEETLTITMSDDEVFTIRVTDANVAKEDVQDGVGYIIFTKGSDNNYYVLKADGTAQRFDNADGFDELTNDYKWTITHVYTEFGQERFNIHSYTNPSYSLALNNPGRALLASGANNIIVEPSGDGYTFTGYNDTGLALVPDGSTMKFAGVTGGDAIMYFYEQSELNSFKFTVTSSDIKMGKVSGRDNVGVMQGESQDCAQYTAGTTSDKKNQYTIKAVPQSDKYIFDHWELNGAPIEAGSTINPEELDIPYNGSSLEAIFKLNPNYDAPDSEKEGKGFDEAAKAALQAWLNELKGRQVPLDPNSCAKTAEVYDYDNRIYRVDLTGKSSLTTFDGTIDLGFIMDVSGSMEFPSKLNPVAGKENYNLNQINNNHQNDLDHNKPYYIIADKAGTATVYRLFYGSQQEQTWYGTTTRTGWWAVDASYQDNDSRHFFIGNDTKFSNDPAGMSYQIYTDGDNGKKRKDYLISSVNGTVSELKNILGILALAGSETQNPDVKIAYNTFFSRVNDQQHDFQSAKSFNTSNINWATNGGTATDAAIEDAKDFAWGTTNSATKNYAILITDGAPQAGGKAIANQTVIDRANELKKGKDGILGTDDDVTLITVGLSMGDVKRGSVLLYDLADRDSNNEKLFFKAESGDELQYALYEILQKIMVDADVQANVTDTVGEAFYPIDLETGTQLMPGNVINLNGVKIGESEAALSDEQKAAGYGVLGSDGKTITWTKQNFTHDGWHGTVYVKAKEDLLGGNAVRTNSGDASIEAVSYKTSSMTEPVPLRAKTASDENYILKVDDLKTPLVNVNELNITQNETEWTVYLGTEVDPGKQMEALYKKILVEEKVTKGLDLEPTEKDKLPDHVDGGKENYLYPVKQSISDKRESEIEDGKTPVTFPFNDLLKKLVAGKDYSWWDYTKGEPKYQEFFEAASTGTGIILDYDEYGLNEKAHKLDDDTTKHDASTITIKLTKEIVEGEIDAGTDPLNRPHPTKITGDAVEKYTLTMVYTPDYEILPEGQGGKSIEDFHVGSYGTMYHGHAAGTETSENVHTINVYTKPLEVKKVDPDGNTLEGAKFGIYRPVKEGETGISLSNYNSELTGSYILVSEGTSGNNGLVRLADTGNTEATLLVPGIDYILIETEAPADFERDDTVRHIAVTVENGTYTDLEHHIIMESVGSPEGNDGETVSTARTDMTGYADPYNWNQGVRIAVDGTVIVAADAQAGSSEEGTGSEGTEGQQPAAQNTADERELGANEYIRKADPVVFRTTILNNKNTTTLDVTKKWTDDEGNNKAQNGSSITFKVTRKAGENGTPEDVSLTGHITASEGVSVNNDGSLVTLSYQEGSGWPTVRIIGLEKYTDDSHETEWIYEVTETLCNPEGKVDPAKAKYELTEVNGIRTITIVNIEKKTTQIKVDKKWFGADDQELAEAPEESITFEVYRVVHIPCIHDYTNQEWVTEKAASCTEEGRQYRECSKCHEKEYVTIPANGHSWSDWSVRTPATYAADGVEERTCSVCKEIETRPITKLPHDHVYEELVYVTEPSCTQPGTAHKKCTLCGELNEAIVEVPELGHNWDDGEVTTPATCEGKGIRTFTCSRCHVTQTREIAALGHDYTYVDDPAATCTTAGTRTYTCRNDASHTYSETIAALGHRYGDWETYIEATETTDGENRRYCLNGCGKYESQSVPKLGETFGDTGLPVSKYEWPDTSSWTQDERNKQTSIDPTGIIKYTDKNGNVSYAIIYQKWNGSYEQMKDGPGSSALQNNAVVLTGTIKTKDSIVNNTINPISKGDLFRTDDEEYYVFLKNDGAANNLNNGFNSGDWYHIPKTTSNNNSNFAQTSSLLTTGARMILSAPKGAKLHAAIHGWNGRFASGDNGGSSEDAERKARLAALMNTTPDQIIFRSDAGEQSNVDVWEYVTAYTGSGTGWKWVLENLDVYDDDGNEYTYYVVETAPDGSVYEITYDNNGVKDSGADDTITIKNKQKLGSVAVTKTFAGLPEDKIPSDFKITATYMVKGEETTMELTAETEGVAGNGTTEPFTWTIDNLPIGTVVTFTESGYDVPGYTVVTSPAADDNNVVSTTATAAQQPETASFVNTYTQEVEVSLDIVKIEDGNSAKRLPNAEFTLREISSEILGGQPSYLDPDDSGVKQTTDGNGNASFGNLKNGYYEIRETGTPAGYVIEGDAAFYVRVEGGKSELIRINDAKTGWEAVNSYGHFVYTPAAETENAKVEVSNTPGAALPNTGGRGITACYISGGMISCAAAALLLLRRRRLV